MGRLIGPLSSTSKEMQMKSFVIDVVAKIGAVIKKVIESSSPRLVAMPRPFNYSVAKFYRIVWYTNAGASVG